MFSKHAHTLLFLSWRMERRKTSSAFNSRNLREERSHLCTRCPARKWLSLTEASEPDRLRHACRRLSLREAAARPDTRGYLRAPLLAERDRRPRWYLRCAARYLGA